MTGRSPFRSAALALLAAGAAVLSGCATVPAGSPDAARTVPLQLLAINDFHGNLEPPPGPQSYLDDQGAKREAMLGGAARMGATLRALRVGHANTLTVAAGDMVGASPLTSAYYLDEPAILALNAMGLDITSVGNHEFDRGTRELRRLKDGGCERYTARTPCAVDHDFGGATFDYLAANVVDDTGRTLFPGTAIRQVDGVEVGFIGMTLEDTGNLVAAGSTTGYRFLDEAETANRLAAQLKAQGAELIVVLLHQGGYVDSRFESLGCEALDGPIVDILDHLSDDIPIVISGHTHNAYICKRAMAGGGERLLTSAGRYGYFITDIDLALDPRTGAIRTMAARNVPVVPENGEQADVARVVDRYVRAAAPVARRSVGRLTGAAAQGDPECVDNWTQDLIADTQAFAAREAGADFAVVNTGGVRSVLEPAADGMLNFGQIFALQPFGNTVVTLELTGAQLLAALESQFCGDVTVRPCYSLLIPSRAFAYSFDRSRPKGQRIVAATLNGQPIDRARTYRMATNNFLAAGGDGFAALAEARQVAESGTDVDATEAYLSAADRAMPQCGRVRDLTPGGPVSDEEG